MLPLWLQFTLGYSSLQAGVALLPLAVGSFVASGASFALAEKLSAPALVRIGLVLEAVALAGLGVVAATTSAPWWSIAIPLFVYGIGGGHRAARREPGHRGGRRRRPGRDGQRDRDRYPTSRPACSSSGCWPRC